MNSKNKVAAGEAAGAGAGPATKQAPGLIESVLNSNKKTVLVRKNVLNAKTVRYIGLYGGYLGVECDDVIYIFDKCYETLYVNKREIKPPEWALTLCTPVKKKKKKEGEGEKWE